MNRTGLRQVFALAVAAFAVAAVAAPAAAIDVQRVANPLGVDAWLVEDHDAPSLAMAFDFASGSSQDPADRRGLTNLVVGMLYEGAGPLDSAVYKARLKDHSIQLGWDFDRDSLYGVVLTPTANGDEAARLMNLAMTGPRYDSEAVERVRGLITAGVRTRTASQAGLLAFMAALYPGHIFGVWESGDLDTLAAITVADMQAYRPKIMALNNLKVVAVGDIDGAGLSRFLAGAFAGLPAQATLAPIADAAAAPARRTDIAAPVTQTTVRFGGPAMKRSDPDFAAASAAASILGGRNAGSRLYDALVTGHGLTAAVSFTVNTTAYGGWFAGTLTTRPADTDVAIALLGEETRRLASDGPTAEELARAQNNLIGSYVARFDSAPAAANELVNELADGLGADYPERFVGAVVSLTPADVKRAAARMFSGGMTIVTVGPAATP